MINKVGAFIEGVISLTGLPLTPGISYHGSDADFDFAYGARRTDGIPDNFFAEVCLTAEKIELGFCFTVSSSGFYLDGDRDGTCVTYFSLTVDLDGDMYIAVARGEEIKIALLKAWDEATALPERARTEALRRMAVIEDFRKSGGIVC